MYIVEGGRTRRTIQGDAHTNQGERDVLNEVVRDIFVEISVALVIMLLLTHVKLKFVHYQLHNGSKIDF